MASRGAIRKTSDQSGVRHVDAQLLISKNVEKSGVSLGGRADGPVAEPAAVGSVGAAG
jgi:hypothetical protein